MSIYLDSAIVAEAQAAKELGWVKGITTNPTLLAKSDLPVETTLKLVGFQVVAAFVGEVSCAVTGIYSPSQAVVAKEAGAKYAIAYVNRATRLLGDGVALVQQMASAVAGSSTEIMAASIKSPEEAVASLQAGANHLTLPLTMLQAMTTHELSLQTIDEFTKNGRGSLQTIDEFTKNGRGIWVSCKL